jgi:hypothetical protein
MDTRLTPEQQQLRDAAARLAGSLGPSSVHDLADHSRAEKLEKAVAVTGWRTLRSDGASGVEVAIVAEEFGRGLVDVPYAGPVLADDLLRDGDGTWTIAAGGAARDARGLRQLVTIEGGRVLTGSVGPVLASADLTRDNAAIAAPLEPLRSLSADEGARFGALALVVTCADLLGAARGAHALACEYAKVRSQYGHAIGSYQAVSHPLAEGLALIEGSVSVLRHAAWAVDALPAADALNAARTAKVYCARAALTICETAVQVHGGIGNTWECLVHVYLRRVLTSAELYPARLEEIDCGLS